MSEDTREAFNENLPSGVVASLSKVATPDGFLTFERFCAGVKIALLRQEAAARKSKFDDSSVTLDASSGISGRHSVIGGQHDYENVGTTRIINMIIQTQVSKLARKQVCLPEAC